MALEGSEPVGIAADGTLIDGSGNPIPQPTVSKPAADSPSYAITVMDDMGNKMQIIVGPTAVQMVVNDNVAIFDVEADGTVTILDPGGAFAQIEISPGQNAANKNSVSVKNGDGDSIFQIRGDGSLHGKTGKALTFDL